MDSEKWFLWSKGILGGLVTLATGLYILGTGDHPDPELVVEVQSGGEQALTGTILLIGAALSLWGRFQATKRVTLLPRKPDGRG